jgi:hypothetical protein
MEFYMSIKIEIVSTCKSWGLNILLLLSALNVTIMNRWFGNFHQN